MSTSHFMMELKAVSSMPAASMPTMDGVNSTSGHLKRSEPIVITCSNPCFSQVPGYVQQNGRPAAGIHDKLAPSGQALGWALKCSDVP